MELIIAEKPSVAKEYTKMISSAEGTSFANKNGYYQSSCNRFQISWAVGHLVQLSLPNAYGWNWDLKNLPMLPEKWEYEVNKSTKTQFSTLKQLINKAQIITNGCDAGREGELIFRLIVMQVGALKKPSNRIWLDQFTLSKMVSAWKTRKPSSEYNSLFAAAMCRQKADWIVGMNLSTGYSLWTNIRGLSVGRVQTPTLNIIVLRHLEIINWKEKHYFQLNLNWNNIGFTYFENEDDSFASDNDLNAIASSIENAKGILTEAEKQNKKTNPNRPFDLASLQKEANNKLDLTAAQTLSIAQKLYEGKLISYPRTDSSYLPTAMKSETISILEKHVKDSQKPYLRNASDNFKFYNDAKITDHYAIIPTLNNSKELAKKEQELYDLIVKRFVTAFAKPHIYDNYSYKLKVNNHQFKATVNIDIDRGFKNLTGEKTDSSNSSISYNVGDSSTVKDVIVNRVEVNKPAYLTEATLIAAMENCAKYIENSDLKKVLKQTNGLGTAATRASIIETLKNRKYIEVKGKKLYPTPKGIALIKLVDTRIKSPEMTAVWENKLNAIHEKQITWQSFIADVESYIKDLVPIFTKDSPHTQIKASVEQKKVQCPKCKQDTLVIRQTEKLGCFCTNENCDFRLYNRFFKKKLSAKNISDILSKGSTGNISMKSKDGSYSYKIKLKLTKDFKYESIKV